MGVCRRVRATRFECSDRLVCFGDDLGASSLSGCFVEGSAIISTRRPTFVGHV